MDSQCIIGEFSSYKFLRSIQIKVTHQSTSQLKPRTVSSLDQASGAHVLAAYTWNLLSNAMSSTQPHSGPIPHRHLSDIDFEQPTAIIWPVIALAVLKNELNHYDANHPQYLSESWNIYSVALNSVVTLFGLPNSLFNWGRLQTGQRQNLYQDLAQAAEAFNDTCGAGSQEKMACKYILRWFQAFNTQLDIDSHEGRLGLCDWVFEVDKMREGVADLLRELAGGIVQQYLGALREVPIVLADAINQMEKIIAKCVSDVLDAIKVYIVVKIDREFLCEQQLPTDFPDRIWDAISGPLTSHVIAAFYVFASSLEPGNGKFSEDDVGTTAVCTDILFHKMSEAFSYQSQLFHDYDDSDDGADEDEPLPEHVANHQFDQYQEGDWYARELRLVDTQDILRGPQNVTVSQVSIHMEYEDENPCEVCGDSSVDMREVSVCGHVICEDCLGAQLRIEHACRYKCPYCRAEFFADTA